MFVTLGIADDCTRRRHNSAGAHQTCSGRQPGCFASSSGLALGGGLTGGCGLASRQTSGLTCRRGVPITSGSRNRSHTD